jgi:L-alanine-DL-glutamate epimerase-like enolase superfamily enzyme
LQAAGLPVVQGQIAFPEAPGIGYQLPDEIVRRYRMA